MQIGEQIYSKPKPIKSLNSQLAKMKTNKNTDSQNSTSQIYHNSEKQKPPNHQNPKFNSIDTTIK